MISQTVFKLFLIPLILSTYSLACFNSEFKLNSLIKRQAGPMDRRRKIVITGGAGFIGSHLVDKLMLDEENEIYVYDNFNTGRRSNVEHWNDNKKFHLIEHDMVEAIQDLNEVDQIYHLASPASPVHYMANPIYTIKTIAIGTQNALDLAKKTGARIVIASTSEVYGDPKVHPQPESYWGNTNPIGPRSCYDESKRLSESLAMAYHEQNVSTGVARIFNTYGPRMHPNDGRVVSNFLVQAMKNQSITVHGSGEQTRSFQYITDLVSGLVMLMNSDVTVPVNLGNPHEMTINSLARSIKKLVPTSTSEIVFDQLPIDDPQRRRPDISRAKLLLGWSPNVTLEDGLRRTIEYFGHEIKLNRT